MYFGCRRPPEPFALPSSIRNNKLLNKVSPFSATALCSITCPVIYYFHTGQKNCFARRALVYLVFLIRINDFCWRSNDLIENSILSVALITWSYSMQSYSLTKGNHECKTTWVLMKPCFQNGHLVVDLHCCTGRKALHFLAIDYFGIPTKDSNYCQLPKMTVGPGTHPSQVFLFSRSHWKHYPASLA